MQKHLHKRDSSTRLFRTVSFFSPSCFVHFPSLAKPALSLPPLPPQTLASPRPPAPSLKAVDRMTGQKSPPRSASPLGRGTDVLALTELSPPKRTVMDAYKKTSWIVKDPETVFGTGTRPPLMNPAPGPGPGAYPIKTTMGKVMESHITSPCQFSIRGRTKFGDPNAKALSKTASNEPGPGQYDLSGKFLAGKDPRKIVFPKAVPFRDKSLMMPGPGSYRCLQSMGKQILSTKTESPILGFPKAPRQSMVPPGTSDIGPGEYRPPPAACENQLDSRKNTCPKVKFGEGYRAGSHKAAPNLSDPAPGPGSYRIPGGIATKAKGSPFRDSPTAIMSGREKFGSPW